MSLSTKIARQWLTKVAEDALEQKLRHRRFRNPETGNKVLFQSLPPEEQARIRKQYAPNITKRLVEKAKNVVDTTKQSGRNLVRFIGDPAYRKEVSKAILNKGKDIKSKLAVEARESKEMLDTFKKVLSGQRVSDQDKKAAIDQMKDVAKLAVLGTVSLSPLGPFDDIILAVLTAGVKIAFPEFSWLPSAWRAPIEASENRDFAEQLAQRMYAGIQTVLENDEYLAKAFE